MSKSIREVIKSVAGELLSIDKLTLEKMLIRHEKRKFAKQILEIRMLNDRRKNNRSEAK